MRICIAEDATEFGGDLQRKLSGAGFNVVAATDQCYSGRPIDPSEYDLLIIGLAQHRRLARPPDEQQSSRDSKARVREAAQQCCINGPSQPGSNGISAP